VDYTGLDIGKALSSTFHGRESSRHRRALARGETGQGGAKRRCDSLVRLDLDVARIDDRAAWRSDRTDGPFGNLDQCRCEDFLKLATTRADRALTIATRNRTAVC